MKRITFATLLGLTCLAPVWAQGGASPANPASAVRASDQVTLSFTNTEISEVARAMALITGRSVVLDPRVKGTMSLNTDRPVPKAAAFNQFLGALRLQGYAVVETAGLFKVVPEAEAKLQSGSVIDKAAAVGPGNQIATQIFRLQHENANNLVPVLRPLISPNNTINVNPGNNSLVITDYNDNLQRIGRIVAALDVPNASDLEIIPLKHAIASDLVPLLIRLLESQGPVAAGPQGAVDASYRTTVLSEPRSNAIILRAANAARLTLARSLVERLDQPGHPATAAGNIRVVYLKNAEASKLAVTLRAALASNDLRSVPGAASVSAAAAGGGAPAAGTSAAGANPTSPAGVIQADPTTNALIISAPEPLYRQLRAVIDQLDSRRAQVLVESLIVEVRADKAEEFGIQWQGLIGSRGDGAIGFLGTNFGTGGNNILTLQSQGASGAAVPGRGLNFGALSRTGGIYTLSVLGRFLQENGDGNILSTPTLLTLDNEEAKIVVGQNVPFITGQYTSGTTGSGGNLNPFQTIERRDVGLTLRVRPQISENGSVRLQIYQEVSSISPTVNSSGLITNKRSIESNVLVEDGNIVVLGGLLQDEFSSNADRVPGLSDIPILGQLFRSEGRKRNKSNLMVFLRPLVVRDAATTQSLSVDRYDLMRTLQQGAQLQPTPTLQLQGAPTLPPVAPGQSPGQGPLWSPAQPNPIAPALTAPAPAGPTKP